MIVSYGYFLQGYSQKKDIMNNNIQLAENVNIEKYAGTWYEIARYPHRFERNLAGVTATYTIKGDNKIEVLNQGYKNTLDGKRKVAKGKAYVPDVNRSGHLKVSFFLFFYADYYILELDPNYEHALVGSSSMNYLWILCRKPVMDEAVYKMLLEKAVKRGYDISRLELVKQK